MEKRPPYLAFLYAELLRKPAQARFHKKDPSLVLTEVFSVVDKSLLNVAKQRLGASLRYSGINYNFKESGEGQSETAAALLKDQQKQLERAGRAMAEQSNRPLPWMANENWIGSSSSSSGAQKQQNTQTPKRKMKKK